ncbi:universal stress protein [Haliangium sp.]|uniref:universal stress protein n=1 Tax=Haliangium sp. TaxID=2663208 RepID=UPI003D0D9CCF
MNPDTPYHIVFAIDFSEMTDAVIQAAIAQAQRHRRPTLHAVCALDIQPNPLAPPETADEELDAIETAMRARVAGAFAAAGHDIDAPGDWSIHLHARSGRPAETIAALAEELRADVIILGRHGRTGGRPFILGSVPIRLMQLARCTVMVVQPKNYPPVVTGD